VVQAKDRAELLAGAREISPLLGVTVQSNASSLIRERNNIQASTSAIDGVLAQAGVLGSNLHEQRGLFDSIGTKLMTLGSRFPVINGLMNAIRRRKSWDTVVVTSLVVICSLILLMYLFRKWL
jgi:golgi SNAP receptor complex member 1